ncbi:hypothetical protein ACFX16_025095 [Malus domestica]
MEVQTREEEERGKTRRSEGVLQPSEQKKWKEPPFGSWKVNCDATWHANKGTGAVGWVIRDFVGLLQLAGGTAELHAANAQMAEAVAMRDALGNAEGMDLLS